MNSKIKHGRSWFQAWPFRPKSDPPNRDEYAMRVLPTVVTVCKGDTPGPGETMEAMFARKAYVLADAMLAAREVAP